MHEMGCEIERKSDGELQAYYQCDHGIWAFNDKTEDCHCQIRLYKSNLQNVGIENQSQTPKELTQRHDKTQFSNQTQALEHKNSDSNS